jgi:ribose 1,5-bisphosphate isomerase
MTNVLKKTIEDIKGLKIQGARNVARASIAALVDVAKNSKAKDSQAFYSELTKAAKELEATRPTEPMMRNSLDDTLRFMISFAKTHPSTDPKEMVDAIVKHEKKFEISMQQAIERIAQYGASQINFGSDILIHCHSSTVIAILKKAHDDGKKIKVTCLETRPLYQGRISARTLAQYGIDTTLIVDSASGTHINKMDMVLVGADALTASGDLLNKIGTYTLAQLAKLHSIRFYSACEMFKYDKMTRFGRPGIIEQRDKNEVWGTGLYSREMSKGPQIIPKGLTVLNSAFDLTPASLISAYITEDGLIPPAQLSILAEAKLNE